VKVNPQQTKIMTTPRSECRISDRIPDTNFPYRTFYYSPGSGFETGRLVYVGFNEWRTHGEAVTASNKWEAMQTLNDAMVAQTKP
jgi:hypothetical protein